MIQCLYLRVGALLLYAHKPYHLDIGLDPGFKEFYYWCKDNGVPFVIVSR